MARCPETGGFVWAMASSEDCICAFSTAMVLAETPYSAVIDSRKEMFEQAFKNIDDVL